MAVKLLRKVKEVKRGGDAIISDTMLLEIAVLPDWKLDAIDQRVMISCKKV